MLEPNRNGSKIVTISAPNGAVGHWILTNTSMSTNIVSGIIQLGQLVNSDSNGFKVELKECVKIISESIIVHDEDLAYIDVPCAILYYSNGIIKKNIDIFSRMVREASINESYREWIRDRFQSLIGSDGENGDTCGGYKQLSDDFFTALNAIL